MTAGYYQSKRVLLIETLALTIFPLILLRLFPGWLLYRTWLLSAGTIYVLVFFRLAHIKSIDLGFQKNNFVSSLKSIMPLTVLAMLMIIILRFLLPLNLIFPIGVAGIKLSPSMILGWWWTGLIVSHALIGLTYVGLMFLV